jgi:hypothetical protein
MAEILILKFQSSAVSPKIDKKNLNSFLTFKILIEKSFAANLKLMHSVQYSLRAVLGIRDATLLTVIDESAVSGCVIPLQFYYKLHLQLGIFFSSYSADSTEIAQTYYWQVCNVGT